MVTILEKEEEINDNCVLTLNEALTPVMRKLEACRLIKSRLSDENKTKGKLQDLKLWYTYRRLVSFINSNGAKSEPSDNSLLKLSKLAEVKLEVKVIKDYVIEFSD